MRRARLGAQKARNDAAERVAAATSRRRAHAEDAAGLSPQAGPRPLLMVDIDGVISLFGAGAAGAAGGRVVGTFHSIEGIPHFLSATAATHLLTLETAFELVWASGWEERANEHLPNL